MANSKNVVFFFLAAGLLTVSGIARAGLGEDAWAAIERKDYATAFSLLRPLAELGDARPQYNVGLMFNRGQGVPQDYAEAVKWLRLAAEQGNAGAQLNLGAAYFSGQGVPQDYNQAHLWFNLAAAQATDSDRKAAEARDNTAALMTPTQVAEAQRLAREWSPK